MSAPLQILLEEGTPPLNAGMMKKADNDTTAEHVFNYQSEKSYSSDPNLPSIGHDSSKYTIKHAEIINSK